jgi:hypothetical protein
MHSTSLLQLYAHPFTSWLTVAARTAEMLTASIQVVAVRTAAWAAPVLSAKDHTELALMRSEKVEAFTASAVQWAGGWNPALHSLSSQAMTGSAAVMEAALCVASSRSLPQAWAHQNTLMNRVARQLPDALQASTAAAELTGQAMAPLHAVAVANAKRLTRKN